MKNFFKIFRIIVLVAIIGFSMIACDFFKEKDCSHCGGTGNACGYTYASACAQCQVSWPDCWVCSGTGTVPDW